MACDLVGVAGFEPAASSSRSQVHRSPRWAKLVAGLLRVSIDVRGSPPRCVAIVTQIVTRWLDERLDSRSVAVLDELYFEVMATCASALK